MNRKIAIRTAVIAASVLVLGSVAVPQIREVIKIFGVGAAVKQFGPEMNRSVNRMIGHRDSDDAFTKTVPIITVGLNTRGAIGAAQVMGARSNVQRVEAVAQVEGNIFGEIKIRALVPVDSLNVADARSIRRVEGVGVSGIVDLRL